MISLKCDFEHSFLGGKLVLSVDNLYGYENSSKSTSSAIRQDLVNTDNVYIKITLTQADVPIEVIISFREWFDATKNIKFGCAKDAYVRGFYEFEFFWGSGSWEILGDSQRSIAIAYGILDRKKEFSISNQAALSILSHYDCLHINPNLTQLIHDYRLTYEHLSRNLENNPANNFLIFSQESNDAVMTIRYAPLTHNSDTKKPWRFQFTQKNTRKTIRGLSMSDADILSLLRSVDARIKDIRG